MMSAKPQPYFLSVAMPAGWKAGKSKGEFLLSPLPPLSQSFSLLWGMGWAESSWARWLRFLARCWSLVLLLYCPVPSSSLCSAFPPLCWILLLPQSCRHTSVCVSTLQSKPGSNPPENSILLLGWFSSGSQLQLQRAHRARTAQGVARRGKRRVTRPKVCSGRLQSKHGLEYPNKLSLHSHHYPSELTLYPVDSGHLISLQRWNLVVQILH